MYNRTIIIGRLTADPELRQTQSGVSVTSFSVAVNRAYTPRGGERQTDFFDVVAWRQTAEFIARYFTKGSAILVEGTMESRSYVDKNGNTRRAWELIANNAHFVESKAAAASHQGRGDSLPPEPPTSPTAPPPAFSSGAVDDFTEVDDDDGDLPF
jgi:single-strand DNA-binding protein